MLRLLKWLALFFLVILPVLTIAVANRHKVQLVLDPFSPADPAISVNLPLFVYLFATLLAGLLLGGFATWVTQGKWRRRVRRETAEANRWRIEADQLKRQLAATQRTQLPPAAIGR